MQKASEKKKIVLTYVNTVHPPGKEFLKNKILVKHQIFCGVTDRHKIEWKKNKTERKTGKYLI